MRPIRLEMQAFGPYPGLEVVDFRSLGSRRFFLIHGPTGSGKTTVLDGICYALYGKSSGAERDVREMRSHHSPDELPTQVVLDFSVGRESYRVWRRPEQETPGRRTPLRADATLWQRTGVGDDSSDGVVIETGLTKVTDRIAGLLGFEADQFRQVVLLPQGQFREALTADSAKRQQILEILFGTEVYKYIELALRDKAIALAGELKGLKDRRDTLLGAADAESPEQLRTIFEAERARLVQARKAEKTASESAEGAAQALSKMRQDAEKLDEAHDAAQAVAALDSQAPEYEAMERRCKRARQAASCAGVEALLDQALREETARRAAHGQAQKDLSQAESTARAASERLACENSPDRIEQRKQLETGLVTLGSLAPKVAEIDRARETVIEAGRDDTKARDLATVASARKSETMSGLAKARAERDEAQTCGAELPVWESRVSEIGIALKRAERRAQLEADMAQKATEALQARQLADEAAHRLEHARRRAALLREAWLTSQAAALAAALEPGMPCPVCGSTSHPSPAYAAGAEDGGKAPSQKELRGADTAVTTAETEWLHLSKVASEASQQEASVRGQLAELSSDDRDRCDRGDLRSQLRDAEKRLEVAKSAGQRAGQLGEAIARIEQQLTAAELQAAEAETATRETASRLAAARATLEEKEHNVPVDLRSPAALEAAQAKARAELDALVRALEAAERERQDAGQALAGAQARSVAAEEALEVAIGNVRVRSVEFEAEVREVGFASVDEYHASKMADDAARKFEQAIEQFRMQLHAARERLARAAGEAAGIAEPDLAAAEAGCAELNLAAKRAMEDRISLGNRIDQMRRQLDDLDKLAGEMQEVEAEYAVIARVSDVANGRGHRNRLGMTFERFVLASMLDQVTEAATQRLQVMSRGRYALRRTMDRLTSRSAAGLGLEVFDAYTGRERSVTTLSGGEGFMASLSLALGLADVVQSYAGGIRLDTIFVDEGFGTLDPESLDLAIDTLVELQREGGRLVGVISHVPELVERVDARLEISMTDRGSKSRFVVG
jgi:exonuclease SbcC